MGRLQDVPTLFERTGNSALVLGRAGRRPTTEQLHIFCDASESAFAAVAYLRVKSTNGITCQLVASKTRVAPVDRMTIPRLELMGALLATQLNDYLISSLGMVNTPTTFWTDSQIVIHWIRGDVTRWKQFVRNRVEAIKSSTSSAWWRHCPGLQNPADLPSRGIAASELVNSETWWSGPSWLRQGEETWPEMDLSRYAPEAVIEERKAVATMVNVITTEPITPLLEIEDYSSLTRLLRTMAWVLRFTRNCTLSPENRNQRRQRWDTQWYKSGPIFNVFRSAT